MVVPGLITDGRRAVQFVDKFRIMNFQVWNMAKECLLGGKLLLRDEYEDNW